MRALQCVLYILMYKQEKLRYTLTSQQKRNTFRSKNQAILIIIPLYITHILVHLVVYSLYLTGICYVKYYIVYIFDAAYYSLCLYQAHNSPINTIFTKPYQQHSRELPLNVLQLQLKWLVFHLSARTLIMTYTLLIVVHLHGICKEND